MVYGLPPFYNQNQETMVKWIVNLNPIFPKMVKISPELQDLIRKCLEKSAENRIGFSNTKEIMSHPWFEGVNWEEV